MPRITFTQRLKKAYDVLTASEPEFHWDDNRTSSAFHGGSSQSMTRDSKSILLAPILNRIATDVASIPIRHVLLDDQRRFVSTKEETELHRRLNDRANIDQTGGVLIQESVETMLNQGACAFVPTVVSHNPNSDGPFDILSLRIGSIVEWRNRTVVVDVYNEEIGEMVHRTLSKTFVSIIYNPFYNIMNRKNSTLQRLIDKLALLDHADKKSASAQLDLILQLPYQVKTQTRIEEANKRLERLEEQLTKSRYGVAYIDGAESITPLNRPVKDTLSVQVQYLYDSLHSQLGLTPAVFAGTAGEEEILTYFNRTIYPISRALCEGLRTTFLTQTARTQGQSIEAYPNLWKMAPLNKIAEAADKFTRNEIMSSNEVRSQMGLEKSSDPSADELRNKNISKSNEDIQTKPPIDNEEVE
jgi:hypothetical protein